MRIRLRKPKIEEPAPTNQTPTVEYLNSIWGEISVHNIKTMSDGRSWVINCLTGEVMERKDAQAVLHKKNILWVPKGYQVSPVDYPKFYRWANPSRISI